MTMQEQDLNQCRSDVNRNGDRKRQEEDQEQWLVLICKSGHAVQPAGVEEKLALS